MRLSFSLPLLAAFVTFALATRSDAQALPAAIDADVAVQTSFTTPANTIAPGGGWLHLVPKTPGGSLYVGTFTDNVKGGANSAASADFTTPSAPKLTLSTRLGKVTATMDSQFVTLTNGSSNSSTSTDIVSQPANPAGATYVLQAKSHKYTSHTYSVTINMVLGNLPVLKSAVSDATLFIIVDELGTTVVRDPLTGSKSVFTVPGPKGPIVKPLPAAGAFSVGALSELKLTVPFSGRNVALVGESTDGAATFRGTVVMPGKGAANLLGFFQMTRQ